MEGGWVYLKQFFCYNYLQGTFKNSHK